MKNILCLLLFFSILFVNSFAQPKQNQTNEQLGIQFYQDGEYEKAVEIFEQLSQKKTNSYIYYYYYMSLLNLEDWKNLEKICKRQIKQQPNVQRFKIDLGYAYERSGNIDKAKKVYAEALDEMPHNEAAVKELYNAYLSKMLRDYAILALQKGREILNNNKLFSKELTDIYTYLGQSDKVIREALILVSGEDGNTYLAQAETILQVLLLEDENDQYYLTIKSILQKNIQKEPNNQNYIALLYWMLKIHKDYSTALTLAKSMQKRDKDSPILIDFAKEVVANRDYVIGIEALNYLIGQGEKTPHFLTARYELLNIKYQQLINTLPVKYADAINLEKEFKHLLDQDGFHSGTAEWVRKYTYLLAFYVNKTDEAIRILNRMIDQSSRYPQEKALYKIDLADILLYSNQVWDATLLYSQVDKDMPNDTLGQLAKFKNAKLSFYIGEFKWAESQLDVLRAATTKLIANDAMYFSLLISDNQEDESEDEDASMLLFENHQKNMPLRYYAKADFLRFQNKDEDALLLLDSILLIDPLGKLTDDVYFQKAEIAIKANQYLQAEQYLQKIISTYAYDILGDDATFLLAELYEYYLKDNQKAMEYYQKVMKEYSGSIYANEARKRFRTLRGDNI
jgi:predicted Zn-dependent protease